MLHRVTHMIWNREIGNAISTPRFEYRVGQIQGQKRVKSIQLKMEGSFSQYTVFWEKINTEIMDHRSYN